MSEIEATQRRYARFVSEEVGDRSPLYRGWAEVVRDDAGVAAVLARISEAHRQPPLVFAVARMLGATESGGMAWRSWVLEHTDALVRECAARSIQTNEPLRCAALLPALSRILGPIALLEVGASAGLCLYPDRYSYRYTDAEGEVHALDPDAATSAVVLQASWSGERPPLRLPDVVWRAGVDLAPLDPAVQADRDWLEGLVWPGETGRRDRIRAALDIAAADPAHLVANDASIPGVLRGIAAFAPADATLVVTTPGVLAHIPYAGRRRVIDEARTLGRWITLDAPALHDGWNSPIDLDTWPRGRFALALDGEVLAAVDPLGASVEWRRSERHSRG